MPVFIVSGRGVCFLILVLVCLGAAPKTTIFVLIMIFIVKAALWGLRVSDRIANWRWRRDF